MIWLLTRRFSHRFVTRRARAPRALRGALAALLGALAVLGWAAGSPAAAGGSHSSPASTPSPPAKLPFAPGPGDPTHPFPSSEALRVAGYNLYQSSCSSCHGVSLQGIRGLAPSLIGVGPGPVDFYLSTGRMPLAAQKDEPLRQQPAFTRAQIDALIAFIAAYGGPAAPVADPARGDLALGRHLFTEQCAGCHQSVARGGITLGAQVPDLQRPSAQQLAEAIRMGPYLMPRFSAKQIDQHGLDSLARYVIWTRHPDNAGGWGIYNIGPIPEGIVAWFLALAALVIVARLIGERTA